jgi:hypothetical protein
MTCTDVATIALGRGLSLLSPAPSVASRGYPPDDRPPRRRT